ncbi:putative ribonuclease H protein [Citrus sinensis]|uniref:Ribonuclease H protein n=1 Tax=Citrus sinensis TaxID=2711 RepID=A0ACB8K7C2_CITSI|nr:putative ribonuclease H protein [Citrus sinensis]
MFRPISLCTVAYKTVTKIIANRLQALLPELIGPQQTSFVPGRHIVDNIVIAQEVVHSMPKKTGKRGLMAIKVDLQKAYDRLNWSFIFETLQQTGLPIHLSRLIMECVTSASMNILWNGEVTEEFYPGRGIRQGDPLSPYIFVLCIKSLSHGITQAVVDGSWKPIRLVKHGTPLTHLFFANDLLLFAEASIDQAHIIDAVLENYCRSSEAKVNKVKTTIFFSKNVASREGKLIGAALRVSITHDLGNYLGMSLLHSRVNKATYQSILDKVDMRLSGWNAAHLSFAGRITLAQLVIQAMPIYAMQTTMFPSSVRHRIDKYCRRFILDGKSKSHKMCMVGWDKICLPNSHGGLGFKNLGVMNHALLMKISWGIISNSDTLWVRVLCSKYGLDPCNLPSSLPDKQGSRVWSAIRKTWDAAMHRARWAVCNGARIRFWLDCWVTKYEPLIGFALQPIPQVSLNATVSDFINEHSGWRWLNFELLLPPFILLQIASIMPPAPHLGPDRLYWCFNPRGLFTVRSAYESLCHHNLDAQDKVWNLPWSWKGPQSIKLFIWQILHGKLKTYRELSRRNIPVSDVCVRCGISAEDILHAVRDCRCIKNLWLHLVPARHHLSFFQSNLRAWIAANMQNKWKIDSELPWDCIFGVAIWRLWFWQNHFIMAGNLVDSKTIYLDIMARASEIHRINNSHLSQQPRRKEIFISWLPPPWPWCKLNTDGSYRNTGEAGAGGIIRDSFGNWISGFSMNIGESSVIMAELWGLYQGLSLAWNVGIRHLLVEVDSLCVTQMISQQVVVPNVFYALVVVIRDFLSRNW